MNNKNFRKDFVWNTIGSCFLVAISLLFLVFVTRINGLKIAGYFSFGFSMANFLYIFACFGGRSYQVTDEKNEYTLDEYVSFKYMLYIITIIFSIIFFAIMGYNSLKYWIIILLIGTKCLDAISDSYYGVLQKKGKLYICGISLTIRNLLSIIIFLIVDILTRSVILSIISWLLIYIILLVWFDFKQTKKVYNIKLVFSYKLFKNLFKSCFYFFILIFAANFLYTIPRIFIDFYEVSEVQAVFNILIMPATALIVGIQFFVQPILVKLSDTYIKNKKDFKNMIYKLISICACLEIVCLIAAYFIGVPILNIIYGVSLEKYKTLLMFSVIAGGFIAITSSQQTALIIMRKTKLMAGIYLLVSIISIILSYILTKYYGIFGATLEFLLIFILLFILLQIAVNVLIGKGEKNEKKD